MPILAFSNPKRRSRRAARSAASKSNSSRSIVMRVNPPAEPKPRRKRRAKSSIKNKVAKYSKRTSAMGKNLGTSLIAPLKDKSVYMQVGGALLANAAVNLAFNKLKDSTGKSYLPGMTSANGDENKTVKAVYAGALPLVAAVFVRRQNAALAQGLVIGGIYNLAQALIAKQVESDATSALRFALPPSIAIGRFNSVRGSVKAMPVSFKGVRAYPNGMGLPKPPNTSSSNNNNPLYSTGQGFRKNPWAVTN